MVVGTYILYLVVSVALTIWVGRTLFVNGRVFLIDVFAGNEPLADSVNQLLVVGFYLVNLGFVSLALKLGYDVTTLQHGIEALSRKLGFVLPVLGGMHLFNVYLFTKIQKRPKPELEKAPVGNQV